MSRPQLLMLAGPNGAGKSTFWEVFLEESPLPFLNADLLAARTGLDSFDAARFLDERRKQLVDAGPSFITETVFSDPAGVKLELLERARANGYDVILIYVGLDLSLSRLRIQQRVALGGHDVPSDKLAGRHERSLANLAAAIPLVGLVKIYDNASVTEPFRLVATFENGERTFVARRIPKWARAVVRITKPRR